MKITGGTHFVLIGWFYKKKNKRSSLFRTFKHICAFLKHPFYTYRETAGYHNSSLLAFMKKNKINENGILNAAPCFFRSYRKQSGRSSMMKPGGCATSDSFSLSSRSLNQLATERKRSSTERLVRVSFYSLSNDCASTLLLKINKSMISQCSQNTI